MKEEVTDADDYADWIRWVSDAEQGKQAFPGAATCAEVPVLLQVQQMNIANSYNSFKEWLTLSEDSKASSKWEEICQKIRVDQHLDEGRGQQFWGLLERFQDVFAWNKGEFRLLYCRRALHRHTGISTLQGSSWSIVILKGGRGKEID